RGARKRMSQPYIELTENGKPNRIVIAGAPITIGRHAENTIVLQGAKVSRYHAVIERAGAGVRVRDLRSSNGTFVNRNRIEQQALTSGDVIHIGDTRIAFLDPANDAPAFDEAALE